MYARCACLHGFNNVTFECGFALNYCSESFDLRCICFARSRRVERRGDVNSIFMFVVNIKDVANHRTLADRLVTVYALLLFLVVGIIDLGRGGVAIGLSTDGEDDVLVFDPAGSSVSLVSCVDDPKNGVTSNTSSSSSRGSYGCSILSASKKVYSS